MRKFVLCIAKQSNSALIFRTAVSESHPVSVPSTLVGSTRQAMYPSLSLNMIIPCGQIKDQKLTCLTQIRLYCGNSQEDTRLRLSGDRLSVGVVVRLRIWIIWWRPEMYHFGRPAWRPYGLSGTAMVSYTHRAGLESCFDLMPRVFSLVILLLEVRFSPDMATWSDHEDVNLLFRSIRRLQNLKRLRLKECFGGC